MSTNKVYSDRPNFIPLAELETRWDYADPEYANGIPESLSIDQSKHSIFGASKVAGDVMPQEYGRYFHLTVELPLKTIVRGCSCSVIPITWRNRRGGEAKLKLKEMVSGYFFICLYVWLEKYFSAGD